MFTNGVVVVFQLLSCVCLFGAPGIPAHQASLSFTISQNLLKLMFIESVMPSKHLILCCLLLLPSIFSSIRVFSNESVLHIRFGHQYWSSSFSIGPSNGYSGLISLELTGLISLRSKGLLRSLLQHRSSKASILQRSAFFMVQLLHLNMVTGKTIALTIRVFVGKMMYLLFSSFVIAFLPRSNCLLISWLQSPSAVFCGTRKNICPVSIFSSIFLP